MNLLDLFYVCNYSLPSLYLRQDTYVLVSNEPLPVKFNLLPQFNLHKMPINVSAGLLLVLAFMRCAFLRILCKAPIIKSEKMTYRINCNWVSVKITSTTGLVESAQSNGNELVQKGTHCNIFPKF